MADQFFKMATQKYYCVAILSPKSVQLSRPLIMLVLKGEALQLYPWLQCSCSPTLHSLCFVYSNLYMCMYAIFINGGHTLWFSTLGQPPNHDQHLGLGHRPTLMWPASPIGSCRTFSGIRPTQRWPASPIGSCRTFSGIRYKMSLIHRLKNEHEVSLIKLTKEAPSYYWSTGQKHICGGSTQTSSRPGNLHQTRTRHWSQTPPKILYKWN